MKIDPQAQRIDPFMVPWPTSDTLALVIHLMSRPPATTGTWSRKGKWVHYAKIAFEKYVLKLLGIKRVND